ncbi:hypothetical protein Bealeia2_01924 (plasmid) [Candidatus Bealeia paramacronuclearis]|nr:hypothetical protein [Candidatus Bealeia paramacronuclearis]
MIGTYQKQQRIEFRQHQLREQHATLINRKDTLTSEILYAREALLRQAVCEFTDAQKADVFLMFVEDENQKGNSLQTETNPTPWDQLSYLDGLLWTSFLSQWISKSLFQGDVTEEVERQLLEEKTADRLREVEQELAELALQYRGMALGDVAQDTSATAPEDTPKAIATSEKGTPEMLTQKMTINFHATQDAISVNSWENIEFRKALHEILGLTYIPSAYEVSVFEVCTPMSFLSLIDQKRCESDTTQDKKYALC